MCINFLQLREPKILPCLQVLYLTLSNLLVNSQLYFRIRSLLNFPSILIHDVGRHAKPIIYISTPLSFFKLFSFFFLLLDGGVLCSIGPGFPPFDSLSICILLFEWLAHHSTMVGHLLFFFFFSLLQKKVDPLLCAMFFSSYMSLNYECS
jgi:hypothetical protein